MAAANREVSRDEDPIVIAHRGASGYIPEHTLAAYAIAILQGADFIEPDLVMTKDGVLVARHENEISGTTDVAEHPEFAERKTTKLIDGEEVTGWFTEDFTLAELKTLRAKERLADIRPANTRFDGLFEVPTLQETLDLVRVMNIRNALERRHSRERRYSRIGVYPETKHPSYFDGIGLSMEEPLVEVLHRNGYHGKRSPVFIQSFEVGNLKELNDMTRLALVQLINDSGAPYDFASSGDPKTYADLITPQGLAEVATYAEGIGVNKDLVIPRDANGALQEPSSLIDNAHKAGLIVHAWTFRAENTFLPTDLQSSDDPADLGDLEAEIVAFLKAGLDGFFTDHPDIGVAVVKSFAADR